jgi:hypothetical protein
LAQRTTEDIIAQIETVADSAKRLPTLLRTALGSNTALDKAVRAWALSEPVAKNALTEVEAVRVQYLEQLLNAANVPVKSVKTRAHILHWVFIGYSNSCGELPEDPTAILDEVIAFAMSDISR